MPVMVNEITIEPTTATPPPREAAAAESGGKPANPSMERELERQTVRRRERAMRLWAH